MNAMKGQLTLTVILFLSFCALASSSDSIPKAKNNIYEQEAAYYLNHLDSFLINSYYKKVIELSIADKISGDNDAEIIEVSDSVYMERLNLLNNESPFDFTYNEYVGAFINLYVNKKRELTESCLALSEYYFPVFEEVIDKYDLPMEFKYLAVVESALNIKARSRAGAAGLWQFMYRTGKHYDLEINSYVDDRYELYASTDAACRYFKNLYEIYGNWELVIAAYNCGPGNVNKAIRRSGGKNTYWEIRKYLPRETRGYVPAFVAVNYAMNYHEEHGLLAKLPDSLNLLTDTIQVKGHFDLAELSEYFCADIDQLIYLNPSLRLGKIPENDKRYTIRLPIGLMNAYLSYNDAYNSFVELRKEIPEEEKPVVIAQNTTTGVRNIHVVQSGEVLGVIAEKYGVGVSQVKDWNNLYSSRIYEGQKLVLYLDKKIDNQVDAKPEVKVVQKDNPAYKYHVIKPGDTLWDIAKLYDGLTVTELKRLNQGVNYKKLKPGDKLIVSPNS